MCRCLLCVLLHATRRHFVPPLSVRIEGLKKVYACLADLISAIALALACLPGAAASNCRTARRDARVA